MAYQYEFPGGPGPRRLARSARERMWAGVAGGLAEYFDLDPVVVRLTWVAAAILSGGLAVPIYLVLWWVMPRAEQVAPTPWGWPPRADSRDPTGPGIETEPGVAGEEPGATREESASTPTREESASTPTGEPFAARARAIPPDAPPIPPPVADVRSFQYLPPFDRSRRRQQTAGLILIVLGLLFLSERLGLLAWFRFQYTWPVLLIVLGVAMLFRRSDPWRR